jgi:subtilisin-like proprotein convertase family protein
MKRLLTLTFGLVVGLPWMMAVAQEEKPMEWNFDKDSAGQMPTGWKAGYTNPAEGKAVWAVSEDPTAPSPPYVLSLTKTESAGSVFNLAIAEKSSFKDVDLTVKIKANSGKDDQGGGMVWRYKDENNYYICRINPLENNYRLYKVVSGKRQQLQSADVKVDTGKWYEVRAKMAGQHITCYLDGQKQLEVTDDTFKDAGKVGLWTKADSASSFDNIVVKEAKATAEDEKVVKPGQTPPKPDQDDDDDDDDDDDAQPAPKNP